MKRNILFAPIHYILDARNAGSEFSWAYQIYQRISKNREFNSTFIAGGVRDINDKNVINCNVFDAKRLNLSLGNILKFYFSVFLRGREYFPRKGDIILHHVLPFAIDNSFNLLAIFTRPKFVIGPVQSGLVVQDIDISKGDALGFTSSKAFSLQEVVEKISLLIIRPVISLLSNHTLRIADKIIVVNEYTKLLLMKKNIPEEKLIIIPPGIDSKKFAYVPFSAKKSKVVKLIAVGNLRRRKGMDVIIRAMQKVVRKKKNVQLVIVGDGPQREALKKMITELNLTQWVTLVGFVPNDEVDEYYKQAHIFVNMSKAEAFATISLEAMASGLAIISSRVGGFSDTISDGVNGYLINQEDDIALAEKILSFIANPKQIALFGERSREIVEKEYDWDTRIIPKYTDVYNKLFESV